MAPQQTVTSDLDADEILEQLRALGARARECDELASEDRAKAEELIRAAKDAKVCTVPELADAFGVGESRIYQVIAPNYRPGRRRPPRRG